MAGDVLTGSNMYAYCSNNPVMRVDPTGMVDLGFGVIGQALATVAPVLVQLVLLPTILHDPIAKALEVLVGAAGTIGEIQKILVSGE